MVGGAQVMSVRSNSTEQAVEAATTATTAVLTNSPSHLVMQLIEHVHLVSDLPYWGAIIATTFALRLALLPIGIKTAQSTARLTAVRPVLQKISDAMLKDPNVSQNRAKYALEQQAIWKKYKVNPLLALLMPVVQLPIFMSFFFGLRDMGTYFPLYSTGGAFWFTDLTAADPFVALPLINALTFLAMVEIGADGLQTSDQGMFKNVMRVLSVAMIPLTMHMPQGLFVYWSFNNVVSIVQAKGMQLDSVRNYLDIPKAPAQGTAPNLKMRNPFTYVIDAIKKERSQHESAVAEIVDGSLTSPSSKSKSSTSSTSTSTTTTTTTTTTSVPPPVTFAVRPPQKKKSGV